MKRPEQLWERLRRVPQRASSVLEPPPEQVKRELRPKYLEPPRQAHRLLEALPVSEVRRVSAGQAVPA
ncbi:MAG: hypothetical protein NTNFB01_33890 [Nitrospira sp.]